MKWLYWNNALAWKEWKQNSRKFWGVGVLMSMTPIITTIFFFIIKAFYPDAFAPFPVSPTDWSTMITRMVHGDGGTSSMGLLAILLALGLGALLIAQERPQQTLEFLAATPVGRRAVAGAKFLVGAGVIVGIMLVNLLFIITMAMLLPTAYTPGAVWVWFAVTTAVLLAAFALGFLVAVVTGNLLASLIGTLVIAFCPELLMEILKELLVVLGVIGFSGSYLSTLGNLLSNLGVHLTLPFYIQNYHYGQVSPWLVPGMLLVTMVFFVLAVYLFERNPLEMTGQALMFGNSRAILRVTVSLTVAVLAVIFVGFRLNRGTIGAVAALAVLIGTYAISSLVFLVVYKFSPVRG